MFSLPNKKKKKKKKKNTGIIKCTIKCTIVNRKTDEKGCPKGNGNKKWE